MNSKRGAPTETNRNRQQEKGPQAYDFLCPDRIPPAQLRAIESVQDTAARSLSSSLSAYLGAHLGVTFTGLAKLSFEEFAGALVSPSLLAMLSLKPHDGFAALALQPNVLFPVLEMLLGRRSVFGKPMRREITEIEQRLLDGMLRIVCQELRQAWAAFEPVEFALTAIEKEPQYRHLMAPQEALLIADFQVQAANAQGTLKLGIPAGMVNRIRPRGGAAVWTAERRPESEQQMAATLRAVEDTPVAVDVRLRETRIRLGDLAALAEGDLLVLDHSTSQQFRCMVNGVPALAGRVLQQGRKMAFEVRPDGATGDSLAAVGAEEDQRIN